MQIERGPGRGLSQVPPGAKLGPEAAQTDDLQKPPKAFDCEAKILLVRRSEPPGQARPGCVFKDARPTILTQPSRT